MEQHFSVIYAGHTLVYSFLHRETPYYFRKYIQKTETPESDVHSSHELITEALKLLPDNSRNGYAEFRTLIGLTAKELLRYDCSIFHAVSFILNNKAFLLTAPSGVGKTTQYMNWVRLFPNEIQMICGDMPVLERRKDSVWVHPSPWNGKERIGSFEEGQLEGIVLLEQGRENRIERITVKDALIPVFGQFMAQPETEEEIEILCSLTDQMMKSASVYRLINRGDEDSTRLLREALLSHKGGFDDQI